ncbi:MAG: hypothetical protein HW421_1290 [Ignavibacteria bacterium]|nr:hypothetical protein [Ignavibacteria bacterium]
MMQGSKPKADAAFTEIYNRYARRINTYCIGMIADRDDAQDIFQETFVKFYNSVSGRTHAGNLGGLIYTIARNLCMNYFNRKHMTVPFDGHDIISDYSRDYDKNELFKLILTSLDLLDDKYREAYILRELDCLPYQEIAEICGITLSNAKSRVDRARDKMMSILEPYVKDLCK